MWIAKDKCTGCGVCENICPRNAISMKGDECGFIYPEILEKKCVNCGMCEKVCNSRLKLERKNSSEPLTYAAWTKNTDTRFTSTSGGIFTELSIKILGKGGYVAGALYNKENLVEHFLVNDLEGLEKLKQSKYIQSISGFIYKQVKEKLDDDKLVAFCGAPCQVAALYAFLGKEYENLITFDFICRGMNSPKAYKSWLNEIEEKHGGKAVKVWFKYKEDGWKKSPRCVRIDFDDKSNIVLKGDDNLFMAGYLDYNLYIRHSCSNCDFKGVPRLSDITLADFWGVNSSVDDDKGTSMVLCNSKKGKNLLNDIKPNIEFNERDFKEILKGNQNFKSSVWINKKSTEFLRALDKESFSIAFKKYAKKPVRLIIKSLAFKLLQRVKSVIKRVINFNKNK